MGAIVITTAWLGGTVIALRVSRRQITSRSFSSDISPSSTSIRSAPAGVTFCPVVIEWSYWNATATKNNHATSSTPYEDSFAGSVDMGPLDSVARCHIDDLQRHHTPNVAA